MACNWTCKHVKSSAKLPLLISCKPQAIKLFPIQNTAALIWPCFCMQFIQWFCPLWLNFARMPCPHDMHAGMPKVVPNCSSWLAAGSELSNPFQFQTQLELGGLQDRPMGGWGSWLWIGCKTKSAVTQPTHTPKYYNRWVIFTQIWQGNKLVNSTSSVAGCSKFKYWRFQVTLIDQSNFNIQGYALVPTEN
jgi:hypothetical protein